MSISASAWEEETLRPRVRALPCFLLSFGFGFGRRLRGEKLELRGVDRDSSALA